LAGLPRRPPRGVSKGSNAGPLDDQGLTRSPGVLASVPHPRGVGGYARSLTWFQNRVPPPELGIWPRFTRPAEPLSVSAQRRPARSDPIITVRNPIVERAYSASRVATRRIGAAIRPTGPHL
jgi:hypothetical protein